MGQAKEETTVRLREKAVALAEEAAREPDYHRRRELEQAALQAWKAVHKAMVTKAD